MATSRTYYGEYSLAYWIELILKKDIVLPPYQRAFVWNKEDFQTLLDSFKAGQFIPPVTIGVFQKGDTTQNLIIDGQQRLTTILLAYLELFPKKEAGNAIISTLADENDDDLIDFDNMIEWNFNVLTEKGRTKSDIRDNCHPEQYERLEPIDEDFFRNTYLGFSYVIPMIDEEAERQKFFSTLFRNINMQGRSLYVLESRAALYYLNPEFKDWFDPEFTEHISSSKIDRSVKSKMDFVRYLSLLSQYKKRGATNSVGHGFSRKMEEYYSLYIDSVSYNDDSKLFVKFKELYPDNNYQGAIGTLTDSLNRLGFGKIYPSIIDMDIHLFGLIYYILFEKEILIDDEKKIEVLKKNINNAIVKIKKENGQVKTPSFLKHIQARMESSLKLYKPYFVKP